MVSFGIKEPLFTSDGASLLSNENTVLLKNELKTVNFKNNPKKNLDHLEDNFPHQPLWVMEFWAGWFDFWGEGRNLFDDAHFGENLQVLLDKKANINFYMFHGGTNFGFTSGALKIARGYYTADVTSYDYDCPITESGELGGKYHLIRDMIAKSSGRDPPPLYTSTIQPAWAYRKRWSLFSEQTPDNLLEKECWIVFSQN
jgi:hypothetical protein